MTDPKNESFGSLFEGLLKNPTTFIATIRDNETPAPLIGKLLLIALGGFLIFGITLGSFSFGHQLWAAPLKTLMGITLSTLICLPSLYIFSALTGTSLGIKDILQGMAGALALIAGLLLGFTPVLWVFSQSTDSEAFFGFLVLATWLIALFFGTGFLLRMLTQSGTTKNAPLRIWIGIFLLVTLQMSTTLRPIIGSSESGEFFSPGKLFFLEHWKMTFTKPTDELAEPEENPITTQPPQRTSSKTTEPQKTENPTQPGSSKNNPFLNE